MDEHKIKQYRNLERLEISWPARTRAAIAPVFLPYMGCPVRCVFCSQEIQTGATCRADAAKLAALLTGVKKELARRQESGKDAPELAFYGGTFTAIPQWAWRLCLDWLATVKDEGLVSAFRCSTRPDCLPQNRMEELALSGCHLVELGVQSFDDAALARCGRGYNGQSVLRAVEELAAFGLDAGIQLMPGMPGVSPDIFMADARLALSLKPACMRFYPCLVLKGTRLEEIWRAGAFEPWPLDGTISILAKAWLLAARANVPVIRMGLAPQAGLDEAILAGPAHPALGSRVMGRALYLAIKDLLRNGAGKPQELWLPDATRGYVWGWKKELHDDWQSLGVDRAKIKFWPRDRILVHMEEQEILL